MANLRPVLIIGLLFLGYMIWVQWQQDYGPAPQAPTPAPSAATGQLDVPTPGGTTEPPLVTGGNDIAHIARFIAPGRDSYSAAEVIDAELDSLEQHELHEFLTSKRRGKSR
mgnify:CR=1 FL=1